MWGGRYFLFFISWKELKRLALSKEPNRVDVSLPSPEEGNRSSFRNVVLYSI
jgi:hypothetical protein